MTSDMESLGNQTSDSSFRDKYPISVFVLKYIKHILILFFILLVVSIVICWLVLPKINVCNVTNPVNTCDISDNIRKQEPVQQSPVIDNCDKKELTKEYKITNEQVGPRLVMGDYKQENSKQIDKSKNQKQQLDFKMGSLNQDVFNNIQVNPVLSFLDEITEKNKMINAEPGSLFYKIDEKKPKEPLNGILVIDKGKKQVQNERSNKQIKIDDIRVKRRELGYDFINNDLRDSFGQFII